MTLMAPSRRLLRRGILHHTQRRAKLPSVEEMAAAASTRQERERVGESEWVLETSLTVIVLTDIVVLATGKEADKSLKVVAILNVSEIRRCLVEREAAGGRGMLLLDGWALAGSKGGLLVPDADEKNPQKKGLRASASASASSASATSASAGSSASSHKDLHSSSMDAKNRPKAAKSRQHARHANSVSTRRW